MLFSNSEAARVCKDFMNSASINATPTDDISLLGIEFGTATMPEHALHLPPLYAVVFPPRLSDVASQFWRLTGTGISSRQAGRYLQALDRMRESDGLTLQPVQDTSHAVYQIICNRIADLVERAPVGPPRICSVSPSDVYLFPSGMSAIYHANQLLLNWRKAESIVMGFTYELTMKMLEAFNPSYRFYSGGADTEIDEFERHLEEARSQGNKIQAVWCECSSNPLLRTTNIERLRTLADKYDFIVVVDDTIGTCANVDVLGVADMVVTSLTKWFNGFADVLAGR